MEALRSFNALSASKKCYFILITISPGILSVISKTHLVKFFSVYAACAQPLPLVISLCFLAYRDCAQKQTVDFAVISDRLKRLKHYFLLELLCSCRIFHWVNVEHRCFLLNLNQYIPEFVLLIFEICKEGCSKWRQLLKSGKEYLWGHQRWSTSHPAWMLRMTPLSWRAACQTVRSRRRKEVAYVLLVLFSVYAPSQSDFVPFQQLAAFFRACSGK